MKIKIFYGWYIVAASVLTNALVAGVSFYGFTAFISPIAATLGWSYAQISLAISLRGLESGVLDPFMGKAADRWPARWLMLVSVLIIGLGYLYLSRVTTLITFYIGFMITAFGSSLGFSMTPTTTVARWFKRNIGKASGLMITGIGLGGLATPLLIKIIDAYGWRTTFVILAAVVCIIGIPVSFIFRSRPEDYGMLPDGKPPDNSGETARAETYDFSIGIKEALKMRAFWCASLAAMLQQAGTGAYALHIVPYLTSLGIERTAAGIVAMWIPLVSLTVRFPSGWLTDIFPKKYLWSLSLALTSIGLFVFSIIGRNPSVLTILFIIIFGLGIGGMMPVRAPFVREYFGTKNFGTIFGLIFALPTVAMVVAPTLAGWVFDTHGVYDPVWLILSGASAIGAFLLLAMPLPSKRSRGLST